MAETHINDIISSGSEVKGLELLEKRSFVRSLSDTKFSTEEMHWFLMNLRDILESPITGSEKFPGGLLQPFNNIFLDNLLVEYYMVHI